VEKDFAMNIASVVLVVAAVGVNFGWRPSKDDPQAYEVLMQVEPELVDVMARGRELPIESHVPKEVAPIRNIRVIVGSQKLPRMMIAAKDNAGAKSDRIVRGQEPIEHTANFQADAWGPSSPSRQIDQRGATIGSTTPSSTAETNPWTLDNAEQSLNNAGNSLRKSVNSSIEQVNQQFNQTGQDLYDRTKDAASDFGNQLQGISGFGGQSAQSATAAGSAAKKSWAAPPSSSLATSSFASPQSVTPVGPAWSSIKPELAPPRLATPPLANGVRVASNPATGRSNAGPAFPAPPAVAPQRSLLTNSSPGSGDEEGEWNSVWGAGTAANTPTGMESDSGGMVPVPPTTRSASTNRSQSFSPPPATGAHPMAPPLEDRYRAAQPPTDAGSGADSWANFGRSQNDVFSDPRLQTPAPASQPPATVTPENQSFAGQSQMTQPTIGMQPPANQVGQSTTTAEEVPWKPLLAVSLALAGSLGANFYLGMSYAEARHRYRSLVAKTTHAFEKKAGLAA
jgi:hypothetical protein